MKFWQDNQYNVIIFSFLKPKVPSTFAKEQNDILISPISNSEIFYDWKIVLNFVSGPLLGVNPHPLPCSWSSLQSSDEKVTSHSKNSYLLHCNIWTYKKMNLFKNTTLRMWKLARSIYFCIQHFCSWYCHYYILQNFDITSAVPIWWKLTCCFWCACPWHGVLLFT